MKPIFTPSKVTQLQANEVFVFGSNTAGHHNGSGALFAKQHFGAKEGQAEGLQGQSYAIPTAGNTLKRIKDSVATFIEFAEHHKDLTFIVTAIGCNNAGFTVKDIAPMFERALHLDNVILPKPFVAHLYEDRDWLPYEIDVDRISYRITDLENNYVSAIIPKEKTFGTIPTEVTYNGEKYQVVAIENQYYTSVYRRPEYNEMRGDCNYLLKGEHFYTYSSDMFEISENLDFYGPIPFPHCRIVSKSKRFEVKNGLVIDTKYKRVVQCIDYLADHIDVPEGVEEIFDGAFFRCAMTSVTLPKSLKVIKVDAFWECHQLESITLPKNVTYIGDYCFARCFSLKEVRLLGWKVASGDFPFNRCNNAKLYVPKGHGQTIKKILKSTITNNLEEY